MVLTPQWGVVQHSCLSLYPQWHGSVSGTHPTPPHPLCPDFTAPPLCLLEPSYTLSPQSKPLALFINHTLYFLYLTPSDHFCLHLESHLNSSLWLVSASFHFVCLTVTWPTSWSSPLFLQELIWLCVALFLICCLSVCCLFFSSWSQAPSPACVCLLVHLPSLEWWLTSGWHSVSIC